LISAVPAANPTTATNAFVQATAVSDATRGAATPPVSAIVMTPPTQAAISNAVWAATTVYAMTFIH
jgi:hypothetical protein